jgi:hypothetical protein
VDRADSDGVPAGFPLLDEDLQRLSLHSIVYHHRPGARRLWKDLWLSAGIGYSFANRLELRKPSGPSYVHDHLDEGLSASVGLRLRTWWRGPGAGPLTGSARRGRPGSAAGRRGSARRGRR